MLKNVEALSGEPTENLIEDDSAGKDIYEANGWIPETQQVKMSVPIFEAEDDFSSLAQIIDYTDEFPIPGNQGSQGSCTAWAVGYAAKSYLVNVGQKWGVNNHQFSPAYIYNQLNGGEDKGISIYDAMNLVVEQGVCLLTDMPYNQNDYTTQPTQNQRSLASAYRSLSIRRTGAGDINDMKVSLNLGIPIVIGIKVYPDFDKINNANPIYDIISGEARGEPCYMFNRI